LRYRFKNQANSGKNPKRATAVGVGKYKSTHYNIFILILTTKLKIKKAIMRHCVRTTSHQKIKMTMVQQLVADTDADATRFGVKHYDIH